MAQTMETWNGLPVRRIVRNCALVAAPFALTGLAACTGQIENPELSVVAGKAQFSDEDEALYLTRFEAFSQGRQSLTGLSAYDPLEPVEGAAKPDAVPTSHAPTLGKATLAAARAYASGRNSTALIIWRNGVIEEESYFGETERDTLINSRSLSKPVTAILIGRAIEQGYIDSLDQPVADFITEWRDDPLRSRVLVRHLLDMRSGFLPQARATSSNDVLNRAYLHPQHDSVIINEMPVVDAPGTRYNYANATSEMVAPLLERATGRRYADYLSDALLVPLGAEGGAIWVNRPGGMAHSGCCLLLPARTWLRLGVLLIQDGKWSDQRLLSEGYVSDMRNGTAQNERYGLGVWLPGAFTERRSFAHPSLDSGGVFHSEPYADRNLYLFDGNGNQVIYMIPSANIVAMRLGAAPPTESEWDNAYLPNLLIRDAFSAADSAMPEPQSQ